MDGAQWQSRELYAVFLVAIAVMVGSVWLVVRLRRRRAAPLRHDVEPAWTPLARHLAAGGVAPELAALAIAGYQLDVEGAAGRRTPLPRAVATVADAAGVALAEVQRAVVRRAGTPEAASAALDELRALRGALAAAPGVAGVGALWPDDAAALARAIGGYGKLARVDG